MTLPTPIWIVGSNALPASLHQSVVTLGNFDGVHLGHQALIARVVAVARAQKISALAYTFDPHPLKIVLPHLLTPTLQTLTQRATTLHAYGIDHTIVEPFTKALAQYSPEDFLEKILGKRLQPRHIVVGHDFSFGRERKGRADQLAAWCAAHAIALDVIAPVFVGDVLISSTYVRRCLTAGDVTAARAALGRPYVVAGPVVTGRGFGRTLGFPTINCKTENELLPAEGIYVTTLYVDDAPTPYPAATYIGRNPTTGGTPLWIETHTLTPPPATHARVRIEFLERLRADQKFGNLEELRAQIARDVAAAKRVHQIP